jgi:acyl-CoA dehydrogenase
LTGGDTLLAIPAADARRRVRAANALGTRLIDFLLTQPQREMRAALRAFARDRIAPLASSADREASTPLDLCREFWGSGWLERFLPRKSGEREPYLVDGCIMAEELAYGCAGIASVITLPIFLNRLVLEYLDGERRRDFRERLLRDPFITSFAASEHDAGSDLLSLSATAAPRGSGYVLNGHKAFSSNLRHARYAIVVARTAGEGNRFAGAFSWFLVPMDLPGVRVGRRWETLGLRAMDLSSLELSDVEIESGYRLGAEGRGLAMMGEHLAQSRTGIAAIGVGIARRARDEVLSYGLRRRVGRKRLTQLQDYRFRIVEMEADIASARALVWLSAAKYDAVGRHPRESSLAKLVSAETAMQVTVMASLMLGSVGYTTERAIEKLLRDARHVGIVEGPDPVQKELVYADLLRHPDA